jgi:hypothetical protein
MWLCGSLQSRTHAPAGPSDWRIVMDGEGKEDGAALLGLGGLPATTNRTSARRITDDDRQKCFNAAPVWLQRLLSDFEKLIVARVERVLRTRASGRLATLFGQLQVPVARILKRQHIDDSYALVCAMVNLACCGFDLDLFQGAHAGLLRRHYLELLDSLFDSGAGEWLFNENGEVAVREIFNDVKGDLEQRRILARAQTENPVDKRKPKWNPRSPFKILVKQQVVVVYYQSGEKRYKVKSEDALRYLVVLNKSLGEFVTRSELPQHDGLLLASRPHELKNRLPLDIVEFIEAESGRNGGSRIRPDWKSLLSR